ncbi:homocysteine S-methyltransferase [Brevirhabdus pacifica]|uniref:Homocysteine S-methyltransferase n=1 Tax=Brevirhabdus pacifica TaxID=1267768 RepID=A0A1U7DM05_9RHOB|nr:homocysteine S-methyltransferase family protein [Brevirhabdus pacifica]APX91057.1 homocysteine S-methyltransferase [Brevirhabdus pacifica]OWU74607.1 homocysteine methyltransferase [Loktanella sp. 22II-4b]PJJ85590.1 homocysteine S-methyltransferase [Brevirhabdus pacifica]
MSDVTLLDGGMGQELLKRSGGTPTPLWATSVMLEHPGMVRHVHEDYYAAGADVATTNTYALLPDRLAGTGHEDMFERLINEAIHEAQAARANYPDRLIAGSLGPLRASYRPELCPAATEAAKEYAPSVAILARHVDKFLIETMSSVEQARGALMAAREGGRPMWLSMAVDEKDGTRLRSGEALADLAPLIDVYLPEAVLINCSPPEVVPAGLEVLAEFGIRFGAYANGFTGITDAFLTDRPTVDALSARTDMTPEVYADHVMRWVDQGATIVGGCCEIGVPHIAEIARRLGK